MSCGGIDFHSPYLYFLSAGFFLGLALSSLVRSVPSRGKRRSRILVGLYLSLSAFFAVVTFSLFAVDIPALSYERGFLLAFLSAMGVGAVLNTWKRIAGFPSLLLFLSLVILLAFFAEDRVCEETGGLLFDFRPLGITAEGVEIEILDKGGESLGHDVVVFGESFDGTADQDKLQGPGEEAGTILPLVFRVSIAAFDDWVFFPRAKRLARLQEVSVGFVEEEREYSVIEKIMVFLPFVELSDELLEARKLEVFSRYRLLISDGGLAVKKVR